MTTFLSNTPFRIHSGSFRVEMDSIPGYSPLRGELLTDGDMESATVDDWTPAACTLTKITDNPHSGTRAMRITATAASPRAVFPLATGQTYHVTGWAKGNGLAAPRMYTNAPFTLIWNGHISTDWQPFDLYFNTEAGQTALWLWVLNGGTPAYYVDFDDMSLRPYIQDVKVIECITDGVIYVPTSQLRQTPAQAAYGEWEWWFNHAAASTTRALIVASDPVTASSLGYNVDIRSNEQFALRRSDVASLMVSALDYVTVGEWHKLRMTRSYLGAFTAYLDDTLIDLSGGGGTNPTTDNTVITSQYSVFELDAGDKIAFSDVTGNHSIWKGLLG